MEESLVTFWLGFASVWLCQLILYTLHPGFIDLFPFQEKYWWEQLSFMLVVTKYWCSELSALPITTRDNYTSGLKKYENNFFLSSGHISTVVLVLYLSIVMIWCHDVVGWEATLWPITFLKPSFVAFLELLDAKHTTAVLISWEEDWLHLLSRALCSVVLNNEYLVIFLFRLTSFNRCIHYRYDGRWNPKVALIKFFIVLRCFYN